MRSSRWTSSIRSEIRFELRDANDCVLAATGSRSEAVRMLHAFVLTSPGREDDVVLVSLCADGREIVREDFIDLEFAR